MIKGFSDYHQYSAETADTASYITKQLLARLFDNNEIQQLKKFSKLLEKSNHGDQFDEIWHYDQSLGGLGGFAMPSNPVVNPFNTWGGDRNLFRSVQYARSSISIHPTYPRGYIVDVGRSLEITAKYIVDYYSILSRLKNKEMLGKNLKRLYNKKIIDDEFYETCRLLANLTNLAKHEIREEKPKSFSILDGLVAYFSMRKIHNRLLATIDHRSMHETYLPWVDKK